VPPVELYPPAGPAPIAMTDPALGALAQGGAGGMPGAGGMGNVPAPVPSPAAGGGGTSGVPSMGGTMGAGNLPGSPPAAPVPPADPETIRALENIAAQP